MTIEINNDETQRRKKTIRASICVECLIKTRNVPGAVFELGIGTGETTVVMAQWLKANESTKPLYAFDSFERLQPGQFDGPLSSFDVEKCTPEHLWSRAMAAEVENIMLVEGKIEDTLLTTLQYVTPSFVFVDLDVYDSTRFAVRSLIDRLPIGGILAFHDWNLSQTPGIAKVIDEELDLSYKCINPKTTEDTICFERIK